MFKATAQEINAKVSNFGIQQAYGVVSVSHTCTAVSSLAIVAKADDMEAKALQLIADLKKDVTFSYDPSTQGRMNFAIRELEALFD